MEPGSELKELFVIMLSIVDKKGDYDFNFNIDTKFPKDRVLYGLENFGLIDEPELTEIKNRIKSMKADTLTFEQFRTFFALNIKNKYDIDILTKEFISDFEEKLTKKVNVDGKEKLEKGRMKKVEVKDPDNPNLTKEVDAFTEKDLKKVLKEVCEIPESELSPDALKRMIEAIDVDGTGQITRENIRFLIEQFKKKNELQND